MNFIFLGVSALAFPIAFSSNISRENKIRSDVLKNIYKKYQFIDENTDLSEISDDYALVISKKLQTDEIIDHELGLSFKGVTALSRNIQIAEDMGDEKSIQPIKYRYTNNEEIKQMTNGKFCFSSFSARGQNIFLRNIILRKNFIEENFHKLNKIYSYSPNLISNEKDKEGRYKLLENTNDKENPSNYLNDKFIDCNSVGNNIYIQSKKSKLSKGDLKIEYLAYIPDDFLLIGCVDRENFLGNSKKEAERNINSSRVREKDSIALKPAYRYGAVDYILIPFKIQEKNKAKEEIDRFFANEIDLLEPRPFVKRIKNLMFYVGISLIGYGIFKIELKQLRELSWEKIAGIFLKFLKQ